MVVEAQRLPVERLAEAAAQVAETGDLRVALEAVAAAVAEATRADLAVLRVLDEEGRLATRAVAPAGSSLGAEVAGTRGLAEAVVAGEPTEPTRRVADKARAAGLIALPARAGGHVVGSVELIRVGEEFGDDDRAVAGLAAGQLALAVRTLAPSVAGSRIRDQRLELAGEALAAGGDARRVAQQAVRIAVETTGARAELSGACGRSVRSSSRRSARSRQGSQARRCSSQRRWSNGARQASHRTRGRGRS